MLSRNTGLITNTIWNSSFFLFLYHAFPIFIIKKVLFMVIAPTDSMTLVATYILLIVSTITTCVLAYYVLNKCAPSFLSILTGGRNKS